MDRLEQPESNDNSVFHLIIDCSQVQVERRRAVLLPQRLRTFFFFSLPFITQSDVSTSNDQQLGNGFLQVAFVHDRFICLSLSVCRSRG